MHIFALVRTEFARLTSSRIGIAALIALMVVPVVYGGLYLYGNKSPYDNLDRVPAAIVVEDTGATVDGETVNYGTDAAAELLDDQTFGWVEVSAAEARAGVESGRFDFSIDFPASFSGDLASVADDAPREAQLQLVTSDTNSYLSTTLAKQAAEAVRVAVANQVGESASLTLLDAVDSLRVGIVDAGDGASQLADGSATAADGASSLASGTGELATGARSLSDGTATLSAGITRLTDGLDTLDDKAATLPASASSLASGATSIATGLDAASAGASSLAGATAQAAALAPGVREQVAAALAAADVPAETSAPLLAQLDALSQATTGIDGAVETLSPSLAQLATGAHQLESGTSTLAAAAPTLASAVHSAASGASELAAGASSAAAGASELATGAGSAASGAAELSDGIVKLADGSSDLATSLAEGADEVPVTTADGRATSAASIADPVAVDQEALTEAANYGAGLAPFFISLAAWIGIYALFLLVRPLSRRALTAVRRPIRTTLAGWITPALLGTLQMVALFAIVTLGLGLQVANGAGLLGFMVLTSVTFAAIVLALNVLFGSVGQFLGLLLMILQLVTAGGTFPWQTLPAPLAALHQALPMGHAVDGIRQLMYGGSGGDVVSAIVPLLLWLVGSLVAATLGALKQGRFRTLREMRPSPIGA